MSARPYVGIGQWNYREAFRASATPTATSHPQYNAVIGPFRTMRAARFMAAHGINNPHLQTVADAERIVRNRVLASTAGYAGAVQS